MTTARAPTAHHTTAATRTPRVLHRLDHDHPGPTVLFIVGIHGNEPAGAAAVRAALDDLAARDVPIRGRIAAVVGNITACNANRRFIDDDLNRAFRYSTPPADPPDHPPRPRLHNPLPTTTAEHAERAELLATLRDFARAHHPDHEAYAIDLHTFSADGPPFVVFSDTLRNRRFAARFPLPFLLGLAEHVPGTATEYLTAAGFISLVVETGRHDDPNAAHLHESVVRLAIANAGAVAPEDLPTLHDDRRKLRKAAAGAPRVLDVQHRHALAPDHRFVMKPGYRNFQPVAKGEHLADDEHAPVRAPRRGRILLPLYQHQGNDGFFIAREIGAIWLSLSALLRIARVPDLATVLPGVRRDPREAHALAIDLRIARFLAVDVFHLLGFRRRRRQGTVLLVSRRPHDRHKPDRPRP